MNIICNNCVGARLYEVTNQQFPNPFMWSAIKWKDFIKLVSNFEKFDFNNPTFELETYLNNEYQTVLVILNNNVKIHYIYYIQDDTKETPVKENSTNILYKDILSYAKKKWFKRLNRSLEEPTFIFSFNYMKPDSEKYMRVFKELLKINKKQSPSPKSLTENKPCQKVNASAFHSKTLKG